MNLETINPQPVEPLHYEPEVLLRLDEAAQTIRRLGLRRVLGITASERLVTIQVGEDEFYRHGPRFRDVRADVLPSGALHLLGCLSEHVALATVELREDGHDG